MNVLVTGGAGYIGSHATKLLVEHGHKVVVIDNLERGHREAVHPDATLYVEDLRTTSQLARIMDSANVDAVMHFAALAYVGESVSVPLQYYANNVAGTISLLESMKTVGIPRLVFSSTCATYGEPEDVPIAESCPQHPISPYGRSKFMAEQIIMDYARAASGFGAVILRYFNVAGCAADGSLGEDHSPETHLIPILMQAALGQRKSVTIFGSDYDTPDGTCIRDYVHVEDLCSAHVLALQNVQPGHVAAYNVGIGRGYSVREVIAAAQKVTGASWEIINGSRRPGDPPLLYADSTLIRETLGWRPRYTRINEIVATAWRWFRDHPAGYASKK